MSKIDGLIRDSIGVRIAREHFIAPTSEQLKRATADGTSKGVVIGRGPSPGIRKPLEEPVRYRALNLAMTLAACLVVGVILWQPLALGQGLRPLARSITNGWTPDHADIVISYCLGGR